jgi:hypothetical protein
VGKSLGTCPFVTPRRSWKDNIKIEFHEIVLMIGFEWNLLGICFDISCAGPTVSAFTVLVS